MKYALEPYSPHLVSEMVPLWKEHYQELAHFTDIALDPDMEVYFKVSAAGSLRIYTARQVDYVSGVSILVGYNIFVVTNHPHYKTFKQANQDIVYLDQKMRKGLSGYRFMKWCDIQLKNESVQVVYQHARARRSFGPLLERMGYRLMDFVYAKRLDQKEFS